MPLKSLLVMLTLGALFADVYAFVGAFWLGVDAKVETKVKVDQRVLDTINGLPLEVRKQAVAAANEVIDKLDEKVKENIVLLSSEIERVSLQAAVD